LRHFPRRVPPKKGIAGVKRFRILGLGKRIRLIKKPRQRLTTIMKRKLRGEGEGDAEGTPQLRGRALGREPVAIEETEIRDITALGG
jgi:hypothetical protein